MTQLGLFWPRPPRAARLSDPVSSHLAAAEVTRSGVRSRQAEQVLALVRRAPGSTAGELAEHSWHEDADPLDSVQITRRLRDLELAGVVHRGPSRACTVRERRMTTWRPT